MSIRLAIAAMCAFILSSCVYVVREHSHKGDGSSHHYRKWEDRGWHDGNHRRHHHHRGWRDYRR